VLRDWATARCGQQDDGGEDSETETGDGDDGGVIHR
jgi:hypothetical protein